MIALLIILAIIFVFLYYEECYESERLERDRDYWKDLYIRSLPKDIK